MKIKEIQEKEKYNLQLKNKKKVQKLKEKGITLIALVVTIIILLILAGVTLNMALSGDGLFSKAKLAVNKYDVASEQEILQQQIIEYQMDKGIAKIGDKLSDRSITNSGWKVIQLNNSNKNYGTNYYYVPKGKEIANYGQAKYNWVINYETGEVINIEEYTVLDGNAGMSVTDNLALNINPLNLGDQNQWGDNIDFVYGKDKNSEDSGVHGTELKFDGIDDYLRIDNVEIQADEGFTFEFFGKAYSDNIYPIDKIDFGEDDIPRMWHDFRIQTTENGIMCNLGRGGCGSPLAWKVSDHWFIFEPINIFDENKEIYFSVSVDLESGIVNLYYRDGRDLKEMTTSCSTDYLKAGALTDRSKPFCLGASCGGDDYSPLYGKEDLYACRLYTKVLGATDIEKNYYESVNYRKYLINSGK